MVGGAYGRPGQRVIVTTQGPGRERVIVHLELVLARIVWVH